MSETVVVVLVIVASKYVCHVLVFSRFYMRHGMSLVDLTEEMEDRRENGASDLVLQSYDLAIVHVAAIMKACDNKIQAMNEGAA